MTTGSVLSPEMKLMSKPRPTSSSNARPNYTGTSQEQVQVQLQEQVQVQVPTIMTTVQQQQQQPGNEPPAAIMNRRSSWSNPPIQLRQESTTKVNKPVVVPVPDASIIDSALLAALRDPRERIGLLRLEQTLVDFVVKQPQDPFVDVGGPYNSIVKSPTIGYISPGALHTHTNKSQTSFQRCILHRLADRFEITRENNMDGTIRLHKQTQTKVPSRLLLDVKPDEYSLVQSMEQVSLNTATAATSNKPTFASAVTGNNTNPKICTRRSSSDVSAVKSKNGSSSDGKGAAGSTTKNTKMKIMKRANSCPASGDAMHRTNSNASLKNKKNSSLTDREKAYAEARARIFQQEQQEQAAASDAAAADAANAAALATHALPPSSTMTPNAAPFEPSTTATIAASTITASSSTTSATNSKATFRDRNQDVIDPDFRRGHSVASAVEYDHHPQQQQQHYTNPTNDYYGYYNAPQHYPRNHYGAQQQVQHVQQGVPVHAHAWVPSGTKDRGQQQQLHQQGYHQYHHQYPPTYSEHQHQYQQKYSYAPPPAKTTTTANIVAKSDKVGG